MLNIKSKCRDKCRRCRIGPLIFFLRFMYFAIVEWKNRVAFCRLWQSEEPRLQFNFCLKIIFFFPEFLYILFVFNMSRSVSMTIYEMTCSINSVSICVYDIENTGQMFAEFYAQSFCCWSSWGFVTCAGVDSGAQVYPNCTYTIATEKLHINIPKIHILCLFLCEPATRVLLCSYNSQDSLYVSYIRIHL